MSNLIEQAKTVLKVEAQAILDLQDRLDDSFLKAVEAVLQCKGKVILTGIGKSGYIARKIASTMTSTGTNAIYLHPAESSHGDLGIITQDDIVIALSYGGESQELISILNYITRKNIKLISITGNLKSNLAKSSYVALDVHVRQEACPIGLAPTASTTATLALGDALAMTVLKSKGFSPEDFAEYHPGGSLGFRLLTKVSDVMHSGQSLPIVELNTPVKEVLTIMTSKDVRGAAGVVDAVGDLIGVITDGDIRRRLEKSQNPLDGFAKDLMTLHPRTIDANELAEKALFVMEQFSIQMLFVLDKSQTQNKKQWAFYIFKICSELKSGNSIIQRPRS